jgi:hypothetical protein
MPDLATVLREVVETSADPVTVDEVRGLPEAVPRNRRRRTPMLAAAALVLAAGVAGVAAVVLRHDADTPERVTSTTVAGIEVPPIESCQVRPLVGQGSTPCSVTDAQAEALLGIPINSPVGIPEDWSLVHHDVRWYDAADYGMPIDLADYNRSWFRHPEEAETGVPCRTQLPPVCPGDSVQITVRQALREEPGVVAHEPRLDRHAPSVRRQSIEWVADGRYYRLRTYGLDDATVLTIANSLA